MTRGSLTYFVVIRAALLSSGPARPLNARRRDSGTFPLVARTGSTALAAKFEISKDSAGKYRFHLKAANGEIIAAVSESA
jgi:Domain of unknown function (DUF1508)